jgi:hypothetical protein
MAVSAVELRALIEARPGASPWLVVSPNLEYAFPGTSKWVAQVGRILPELVAVVEAAAKAEHEYELCRQGADDGEFALWSEVRLYTALHELGPALHALDEALP